MSEAIGPHQDQPLITVGEPLEHARAAMILLHGRGGTANSILELTSKFKRPGFIYLAPQAAENAWYPNRSLAPLASNEPGLSSALAVIRSILTRLAEANITAEHTILLGFSQGACLALEFAARNPQRYGGLVGLSGALIGPQDTPRDYCGSLAATPIFLGCSDADPFIPKERVEHASKTLNHIGGDVTMHLYPRLGHTVNRDEIRAIQSMLDNAMSNSL